MSESHNQSTRSSETVDDFPALVPKKRITSNDTDTSVDKMIKYLKKKKSKVVLDHTDHLFLSYADSFKNLSPRTHINLKLKLAQIVAEAKMKELECRSNSVGTLHSLSLIHI